MKSRIKELLLIFLLISLIISLILPVTVGQVSDEPTVDFASPKGSNVPFDIQIEITFSEEMRQTETEMAFSISPPVSGNFTWLGQKLIFTPDSDLNYITTYHVMISTAAKNLDGVNLKSMFDWNFTTVPKPQNNGGSSGGGGNWWDFWEPYITALTLIGTIVVAIIGIWSLKKKRSQLSRYIEKLDNTYNQNKWDPETCEHKLIKLKESLKAKMKRGEVEEYHYLILDKKIDDYLNKVRTYKASSKPKIVKIIEDKDEKKGEDSKIQEIRRSDFVPTKGPYKASDDSEPRFQQPYQPPKEGKPPKPKIIEINKDENKPSD